MLPESAFGQKLKLSAELITRGGVVRPVNWCSAQGLLPDGSFEIDIRKPEDLRWGDMF